MKIKIFYGFDCCLFFLNRKDHQWNPNDNKNQQKIDIGGANMSSPGSTWPNNMSMGGAPFAAGGGVSLFDF